MQTPAFFVFDGWSALTKLQSGRLKLSSSDRLDESRQVSDKHTTSNFLIAAYARKSDTFR